jgi:integrase
MALPNVATKPKQIITAKQFEAILANLPARYRTMVLAIETGLRWGELIALRRCYIDKTRVVTSRTPGCSPPRPGRRLTAMTRSTTARVKILCRELAQWEARRHVHSGLVRRAPACHSRRNGSDAGGS